LIIRIRSSAFRCPFPWGILVGRLVLTDPFRIGANGRSLERFGSCVV
jgi:hypothetical protein